MSRSILGGIAGGCASSAWGALCAGLGGLPLWSPLALYSTDFLGFRGPGVASTTLTNAVVTGVVWQVLLGMAVGAVFALVVGALLPEIAHQPAEPTLVAYGAGLGILMWIGLTASRLPVESPRFAADLAPWSIAVSFLWMGAVVGAFASHAVTERR